MAPIDLCFDPLQKSVAGVGKAEGEILVELTYHWYPPHISNYLFLKPSK